jgi:mannan endo-1,4-beta-mannosidase
VATAARDGAKPAPAPSGFVSRVGQRLYLNGSPYRFVGFNLWRANVTSWNRPPNTGYLLNEGGSLDDSLRGIDANGGRMNVIRVWFFQQFANHGGNWDWSALDKTLRVAQANGFKVIATLADQWSYEGPPFKDYTWYRSGYETSVAAPYEQVPYRQWVRTVVAHYASNPTILAWELVNEPDVAVSESQDATCPADAGAILSAFVNDVGRLIKSIDSKHLLSLGAAGNGNCGTIEGDYQTVMSDPSIDLCSFHDYYGATNTSAYNTYNGLNVRVQQCAALDKPIYVGEMGIHAGYCNGVLACRASYLHQKLAAAFTDQAMVGYVAWQFDQRGESATSDDYVFGPGDPGLATLSTYAHS